ncbi:TPA: type III secretion system gatekeeper subunit SctW [Stenotrophomonas maltophilia]|nr:type III secretion system gatekeeper subunit SctW [Stenotrophomonas maltophilia]
MATPIRTDIVRSRPVPQPARGAQKGGSDAVDSDRDTSSSSKSTRPGMLSLALTMQDDLSALVSSLQRRRDNQGQAALRESADWVEHVLDEGAHDKMARLNQLLPGVKGAADLLALLRALFTDPSDALAALRALLADAQWLKLQGLLEEALAQLLDEHEGGGTGAKLRGGLNVAIKARLAARRGGLTAIQLRHSYRDFLAADDDCMEQYDQWIEQYGFAQRGQVMDFMEQAIAADMYALDPSGGQREFGTLLRRIRTLTSVRSVDMLLVEHCTRHRLLQGLQQSAEAVVVALLRVVRGVNEWESMFSGAFAAVRVALDAQQRSQWIQALRRAVHGLPDAAWRDEAERTRMQSSLQALVDADVDRGLLRGSGQCGGLA